MTPYSKMNQDENIWVVYAHEKEIPSLFKSELYNKPNLKLHSLGIGLMESFYQFQNKILEQTEKPDCVILAGTAGLLGEGPIMKPYYSHHFILPRYNKEEIPDFLETTWSTKSPSWLNPELIDTDSMVFSGFGVSLDHDRFSFAEGIYLENMEALGISWVCKKLNIPFISLLVSSNRIGPDARKDWKLNYKNAGQILIQELEKILTLL